jgi:hypothetical protein
MPASIEVELARVVDRDELLERLRAHGFDAREPGDDDALSLEVPCGASADRACDEIVSALETWVAETRIPLVPERLADRVLLRPPGS